MNKIRLTMLLALLTAASSSIALAQGVSAGVKGGLSIVTLSGDLFEFDSRNRVHAGGVVSVDLTQTFSIQIEGLFSQKGSDFVDPMEFGVTRLELEYVEIPILAKVKIATGSVSPYVFAGPAIAFETSCTIRSETFADVFAGPAIAFETSCTIRSETFAEVSTGFDCDELDCWKG